MRLRGARIDLQALAQEVVPFGRVSPLRRDDAEQMQGIEVLAVGGEHLAIERLGLRDGATLMQRDRAGQEVRGVGQTGLLALERTAFHVAFLRHLGKRALAR